MEVWFPWIKITLIALLAFGFLRICVRLKAIKGRKSSILRLTCAAISLSGLVFVAYLALLQTGPRNSELFGSPDGTHVARIMITSGTIVDSDYSSVIVRRTESRKWIRAWSGDGWMQGGGEASPYLHWADDSHLVIDYHKTKTEPTCSTKVDDIYVECHAHEW